MLVKVYKGGGPGNGFSKLTAQTATALKSTEPGYPPGPLGSGTAPHFLQVLIPQVDEHGFAVLIYAELAETGAAVALRIAFLKEKCIGAQPDPAAAHAETKARLSRFERRTIV
jgi:hypothetical protein